MNKYKKIKPIKGEEKYVDLDEDTLLWCIFGSDSGFAYKSFASKLDAQRALGEMESDKDFKDLMKD